METQPSPPPKRSSYPKICVGIVNVMETQVSPPKSSSCQATCVDTVSVVDVSPSADRCCCPSIRVDNASVLEAEISAVPSP